LYSALITEQQIPKETAQIAKSSMIVDTGFSLNNGIISIPIKKKQEPMQLSSSLNIEIIENAWYHKITNFFSFSKTITTDIGITLPTNEPNTSKLFQNSQ